MKSLLSFRWAALVTANALCWCMLCFHQPSSAAPAGSSAPAKESGPFANAVEQRFEMIAQLREINAQLKEQNALLRTMAAKPALGAPHKP
jgi:hypothetical protein